MKADVDKCPTCSGLTVEDGFCELCNRFVGQAIISEKASKMPCNTFHAAAGPWRTDEPPKNDDWFLGIFEGAPIVVAWDDDLGRYIRPFEEGMFSETITSDPPEKWAEIFMPDSENEKPSMIDKPDWKKIAGYVRGTKWSIGGIGCKFNIDEQLVLQNLSGKEKLSRCDGCRIWFDDDLTWTEVDISNGKGLLCKDCSEDESAKPD